MKNYKIAVAGTGYVGLSLGVLLSQHHQVVAVDIVQAKVDMINNKKSPIQDSISPVRKNRTPRHIEERFNMKVVSGFSVCIGFYFAELILAQYSE